MYDIILSFITAFTLTYFAIPSIILVARVKHLTDQPGERRSHTVATPSLGGIGIFAGAIFSIILWTPFKYFGDLQYILSASIIIFFIGVRDDILPISPGKKLLGEVLAATILIFKSHIYLDNMYGVFGIHHLPDVVSVPFTVFIIIVIINAFNLIDGINGLSGSIGAFLNTVLGIWFLKVGHIELAIVAFAMTGALIAFLKYNFTPAQIFMGDTGSLLNGLLISILILQFVKINNGLPADNAYRFSAGPALAIGFLIFPLYDTLRVFTIRIMRGQSPLKPDRRHIHHLLIDHGLTHLQATAILVVTNAIFILFVVYFQNFGNLLLLVILLLASTVLSGFLVFNLRRINLKKKLRESHE